MVKNLEHKNEEKKKLKYFELSLTKNKKKE